MKHLVKGPIVACVYLSVLALGAWSPSAFAQWVNVGVGIDYQAFTTTGPNKLFVTRMARTNTSAFIDTSIANDLMSGSLQTVRNQAARQDDAITWWGGSWGARNKVVVAINGGFHNTTTGVIDGGQIKTGWHAHLFADSFSGFAWKMNRTPFIGQCVTYQTAKVYVQFVSNGATDPVDWINTNAANSLIIFTPQYSSATPAGTRTEVLVEMTQPNITTSGGGYSSGTIRSVAQNTGSTWIPFDHLVLSASGSAGTTLKNNSTVGSEVRIFQQLLDKNEPDVQGNSACQTATGQDWSSTFAAINSNYHFLENGVVRVPDAVAHPGYVGYVNLNPRTAICYNADYVFFVVCDGRTSQSVGISCADLGTWAKNVLGATEGVNNDGGGSSTLVVNGVVKNKPSDGFERAVCNGVLMVNVAPKIISTVFVAGQSVSTVAGASVYLGPGTNYYSFASVAKGAQGTVVSHQLDGVYAKGSYWWKCAFSGTTGWIAENSLVVPTSAPSVTQQPLNQIVAAGGTASFMVFASGTTPVSYQWQKNQANQSNGGHYSGCTTGTLTISGVDSNDVANYRCVVANAYGSVTSSPAALSLATGGCSTPGLLNGSFEGATNAPQVGANWTGYQRAPNPTTVWSIQNASPPTGSGLYYQQIANTSSTGGGGVRQDVTGCAPGATYQISGWMRGNSTSATCTVKCSPTASTDWSTAMDLNPLQTYSGSSWTAFSGTVVATATNMTIWLDGQTGGTGLNKAECFDAVTVVCVGAPPPITQQPGPATTCAGTPAAFSVTATGSGITYQWQKNDMDQADGGHYSGCTTSTLTITNVNSGDAANYRCRASNSAGSTNSNEAALTLKVATAITSPPSAQNVCPGANATFGVTASGDGTLTYQWQTNGVNIGNSSHYGGCTTARLTVTNAGSADAVNYRCVVTGGCGSANSSTAALTLRAATTVTQQPADAMVAIGSTTNLSVAATGDGTLSYQWQKNQAGLNNGGHYSGCTTVTLTISGANTNDTASYRCMVTGGCGSVTSSNATVTSAAPIQPLSFASVEMLPQNQVRLVMSGPPGESVTIQQSGDLVTWLPLTNLVNTSGTLEFTDTAASNAPQRFYRATSP